IRRIIEDSDQVQGSATPAKAVANDHPAFTPSTAAPAAAGTGATPEGGPAAPLRAPAVAEKPASQAAPPSRDFRPEPVAPAPQAEAKMTPAEVPVRQAAPAPTPVETALRSVQAESMTQKQ